jgi:hypothetical protein
MEYIQKVSINIPTTVIALRVFVKISQTIARNEREKKNIK